MNLKITLILLFLATFTIEIFGQAMEGEWYTPLRNKLLHISVSKDSINFRKCSFDITMQDYGYVDMAFKVEKVVHSIYIVTSKEDTVKTYYLFQFQLKDGRSCMNIESANNKYTSINDAENAITNFTTQKMYVTLLNKIEIDKIRQSMAIEKMTSKDFNKYASKIIEVDSLNRQYLKKKFKFTYLYSESTGRILLYETGFNSLVKGNVVDSMFEKFAENPDTKEIFIKMTERK